MKIQRTIYLLGVAFFALALSSCSRGYGCDYGATELKPLDQTEEPVLVTIEDNENTIESFESAVLTD